MAKDSSLIVPLVGGIKVAEGVMAPKLENTVDGTVLCSA